MKEFGKNFNKILGEMFSKLLMVSGLMLIGMVFGLAFALTIIGITPQVFSELLADYNITSIGLTFLIISVSSATIWQFVTLSDEVVTV